MFAAGAQHGGTREAKGLRMLQKQRHAEPSASLLHEGWRHAHVRVMAKNTAKFIQYCQQLLKG